MCKLRQAIEAWHLQSEQRSLASVLEATFANLKSAQ